MISLCTIELAVDHKPLHFFDLAGLTLGSAKRHAGLIEGFDNLRLRRRLGMMKPVAVAASRTE